MNDSNNHSTQQTKVREKALQLFDSSAIRTIRAQRAPRYLKLDFPLLFWMFVFASILGLGLEDVFHVIVYGGWESRAGFVWGSFSPIYGVGAVVLTLFLNRFYYTHNLIIFLVAMVLGAALEYGCSWMMEYFWHAVAWDYTGTFGSINGRTNFLFGVMWGTLGLFWVRSVLPIVKRIQKRFDGKIQGRTERVYKVVTWILVVFMFVNAVTTVLALNREGERVQGIPADTVIDRMLDDVFPDEWLQNRFHNMTVSADVGKR